MSPLSHEQKCWDAEVDAHAADFLRTGAAATPAIARENAIKHVQELRMRRSNSDIMNKVLDQGGPLTGQPVHDPQP